MDIQKRTNKTKGQRMKYFSILKFIASMVIPILGKLLAYVWTPIVMPFRYYAHNVVFNWYLQHPSWYFKRLDAVKHNIYEDGDLYKFKNSDGYIYKRNISFIEFAFAFVFIYLFVATTDDYEMVSAFIVKRDFKADKETDTSMVIEGQLVDFGARINIVGSYLTIGDKQRENNLNCYANWTFFKAWYYWGVIRNGFYGWNYNIEDSILNRVTEPFSIPTKSVRLKTDVYNDVIKVNVGASTLGYEFSFYSSGDKWFFIWAMAKKFGEKYYGFEIGWRRQSATECNQVTRITLNKLGN